METKVHGLEYPGNTLNVFSTVKSGHAINVSKKRLIEIASIIPNRKNGIKRSAFSFFSGQHSGKDEHRFCRSEYAEPDLD